MYVCTGYTYTVHTYTEYEHMIRMHIRCLPLPLFEPAVGLMMIDPVTMIGEYIHLYFYN